METLESTPVGRQVQLSVIVPAYNAGATIATCLDAIFAQVTDDIEVIVVDDGSNDDTVQVARLYPARPLELPHNQGPSAARNHGGANAHGQFLFFLDADVALAAGALALGRALIEQPGVDAVIGSYDDEPAVLTMVSQFKNLAHHYFHQRSGPEATTLFGACTLIRRELFLAVGGFNERRRTVEDVELGYRLTARGARIRLEPRLQVKHLKHWTLWSLLVTDMTQRAIPWTMLWLGYRHLPNDLNFDVRQRLAAFLALTIGPLMVATSFNLKMSIALSAVLGAAAWINRGLYRLFWRRGGIKLMLAGFLLQQLYYVYCVAGLVAGLAVYLTRTEPQPLSPELTPGHAPRE